MRRTSKYLSNLVNGRYSIPLLCRLFGGFFMSTKPLRFADYSRCPCLKWSTDGELSAFDLRLVLSRLARVDRHVAAIWGNQLDLDPCPLIS
jgi:hypothetical protein